jgi:hypothetical protein
MGYRWRRSGVPVAFIVLNDTNCTFTIENVQTNHTGTYTCVVTNVLIPSGRLSSNSVLNVFAPPIITVQPTNQSAYPSETVSFAARAAGLGLRYQWLFNGDDIPGATSTNLVLTNVQLDDVGDYSVVITNLAGSVTSASAALTIAGDLRLRIMQSGGVLLSFDALANKTYRIEYRDSLNTNAWQTFQSVPAGASRQVEVPDSPGTNRFYRLRTPGG